MTDSSLVRPLFPGPVDIVGDVHGELDALNALLSRLGYAGDGTHPEGRRLVFLGDLTDRGPHSPAVVQLVEALVRAGRAQCVLGNHELNLLRGEHKHGNHWFYGEPEALERGGPIIPQVLANEEDRQRILAFFRTLPLALEGEALRVVHSCWQTEAIEVVRRETDALTVYRRHQEAVIADLDRRGVTDRDERDVAYQTRNPVRVCTSGPEERAARPFFAGGKMRSVGRVAWWHDWKDEVWCVFGHYWRTRMEGDDDKDLFAGTEPYQLLGNGRVMCIDYSVGKRWIERKAGRTAGFTSALAALRWPERVLYFDENDSVSLR